MNIKTKTNSLILHIHIAENGDHQERERICYDAKISLSTLNKILKGHMPRFEIRYRIFKATGIKLSDEDDFPELIPKEPAS